MKILWNQFSKKNGILTSLEYCNKEKQTSNFNGNLHNWKKGTMKKITQNDVQKYGNIGPKRSKNDKKTKKKNSKKYKIKPIFI